LQRWATPLLGWLCVARVCWPRSASSFPSFRWHRRPRSPHSAFRAGCRSGLRTESGL